MNEEKYKVIIVDDEEPARRNLANTLSKYSDIEIVAQAADAAEALSAIVSKRPDLVFLDIKMPQQDGFALLDELIKLKCNGFQVVFLTAYSEFAIKAIKYDVFDYILKPIAPDELDKTLTKFRIKKHDGSLNDIDYLDKLKHLFEKNNKIRFKTNTGFIYLQLEQIVYIKADKGYSDIYDTDNNKHTVCKTLQLLLDEINEKSLIKVHKSYALNALYLSSYNRIKKICILKSGNSTYEVPVSNRMECNLSR